MQYLYKVNFVLNGNAQINSLCYAEIPSTHQLNNIEIKDRLSSAIATSLPSSSLKEIKSVEKLVR